MEELNEDGVGFGYEDQIESGLDLEDKFLLGDDVEGAKFQGCEVVLVVEGSQAGGI